MEGKTDVFDTNRSNPFHFGIQDVLMVRKALKLRGLMAQFWHVSMQVVYRHKHGV